MASDQIFGRFRIADDDILYTKTINIQENSKFVKETDPDAFINMIRTESLSGRFYQRPND